MTIMRDVDAVSKKLCEEREKAEAILSSIGDAVCSVDEEKRIILFNKAAEKAIGFSEKEVLGKHCYEILRCGPRSGEEDFCKNDCPLDQASKSRKTVKMPDETYIKTRQGKLIPVAGSAAAIFGENKDFLGGITVFRDITEEQKAEEMRIMYEATFEVEKTRREFISIVSHELRTPMTGIKGWLSMVLDGEAGEISPTIKEYLTEAFVNNDRLLRLVDDMLSVSRIEQGRLTVNFSEIDLGTIIKETVRDFSTAAKEAGLKLIYKEPALKMPLIYSDSDKVKEALTNLVGNALKYTTKGQITITNELEQDVIITHVADTGIGIPPDAQRHLFEKFYRAGSDLSRETQGTGLGLYITKGIVENLGGKIWFKSKKDAGSTFSFSLPLSSKSQKEELAQEKEDTK